MLTKEEQIRLTAYDAYIDEMSAKIEEAERRALGLNEELRAWHQSEAGRDYADLAKRAAVDKIPL